jgi:phytoene dehydrogenase-like protein
MDARTDTIVIGGGLNGLVAAAYLARGGRRPLVLERAETLGGTCATEAFAPGFKAPALFHAPGPLRPDIARELRLETHGLRILTSDTLAFAPAPGGGSVTFYRDPARTAASVGALSSKDARRFPEFDQAVTRIATVLSGLLDMTPPDIDKPAFGEIMALLRTGKKVRDLGRGDIHRVLRWMPMAIADLVGEWFECELVRAAIAARAMIGQAAGPWSAGTSSVLFLRAAADPHALPSIAVPAGGPGALAEAVAGAARAAGVTIRTNAEVVRLTTRDGRVTGVVTARGESLEAATVVSSLDPKRTLLHLVDPADLDPEFRRRVGNIRARGVTAKVNLALGSLPGFLALRGAGTLAPESLSGRILIGHEIDAIERAYDASKYGEVSESPFLEAMIPSLLDPSLAPAGGHVLSVLVQYAPYHLREGDWAGRREALGDLVVKTLATHAPDLPGLVLHRQVLTPLDLESRWGLSEGHIFQGEEALDQIFTMRPLLDCARYATPLDGLYLCGSGTHPGGGHTGANGRNAARAVLARRAQS